MILGNLKITLHPRGQDYELGIRQLGDMGCTSTIMDKHELTELRDFINSLLQLSLHNNEEI